MRDLATNGQLATLYLQRWERFFCCYDSLSEANLCPRKTCNKSREKPETDAWWSPSDSEWVLGPKDGDGEFQKQVTYWHPAHWSVTATCPERPKDVPAALEHVSDELQEWMAQRVGDFIA